MKGFLNSFNTLVERNTKILQHIAEKQVPIIGIDPSMTLTFRDEYKKISSSIPNVLLLQEWLVTVLDKIKIRLTNADEYYLLTHCTEKALCVEAEYQWQQVFNAFGVKLNLLAAGCCGMAGTYGHEAEHQKNSQKLYHASWQPHFDNNQKIILATGYSCRSQVKRFSNLTIQHPLAALADLHQRSSHGL